MGSEGDRHNQGVGKLNIALLAMNRPWVRSGAFPHLMTTSLLRYWNPTMYQEARKVPQFRPDFPKVYKEDELPCIFEEPKMDENVKLSTCNEVERANVIDVARGTIEGELTQNNHNAEEPHEIEVDCVAYKADNAAGHMKPDDLVEINESMEISEPWNSGCSEDVLSDYLSVETDIGSNGTRTENNNDIEQIENHELQEITATCDSSIREGEEVAKEDTGNGSGDALLCKATREFSESEKGMYQEVIVTTEVEKTDNQRNNKENEDASEAGIDTQLSNADLCKDKELTKEREGQNVAQDENLFQEEVCASLNEVKLLVLPERLANEEEENIKKSINYLDSTLMTIMEESADFSENSEQEEDETKIDSVTSIKESDDKQRITSETELEKAVLKDFPSLTSIGEEEADALIARYQWVSDDELDEYFWQTLSDMDIFKNKEETKDDPDWEKGRVEVSKYGAKEYTKEGNGGSDSTESEAKQFSPRSLPDALSEEVDEDLVNPTASCDDKEENNVYKLNFENGSESQISSSRQSNDEVLSDEHIIDGKTREFGNLKLSDAEDDYEEGYEEVENEQVFLDEQCGSSQTITYRTSSSQLFVEFEKNLIDSVREHFSEEETSEPQECGKLLSFLDLDSLDEEDVIKKLKSLLLSGEGRDLLEKANSMAKKKSCDIATQTPEKIRNENIASNESEENLELNKAAALPQETNDDLKAITSEEEGSDVELEFKRHESVERTEAVRMHAEDLLKPIRNNLGVTLEKHGLTELEKEEYRDWRKLKTKTSGIVDDLFEGCKDLIKENTQEIQFMTGAGDAVITQVKSPTPNVVDSRVMEKNRALKSALNQRSTKLQETGRYVNINSKDNRPGFENVKDVEVSEKNFSSFENSAKEQQPVCRHVKEIGTQTPEKLGAEEDQMLITPDAPDPLKPLPQKDQSIEKGHSLEAWNQRQDTIKLLREEIGVENVKLTSENMEIAVAMSDKTIKQKSADSREAVPKHLEGLDTFEVSNRKQSVQGAQRALTYEDTITLTKEPNTNRAEGVKGTKIQEGANPAIKRGQEKGENSKFLTKEINLKQPVRKIADKKKEQENQHPTMAHISNDAKSGHQCGSDKSPKALSVIRTPKAFDRQKDTKLVSQEIIAQLGEVAKGVNIAKSIEPIKNNDVEKGENSITDSQLRVVDAKLQPLMKKSGAKIKPAKEDLKLTETTATNKTGPLVNWEKKIDKTTIRKAPQGATKSSTLKTATLKPSQTDLLPIQRKTPKSSKAIEYKSEAGIKTKIKGSVSIQDEVAKEHNVEVTSETYIKMDEKVSQGTQTPEKICVEKAAVQSNRPTKDKADEIEGNKNASETDPLTPIRKAKSVKKDKDALLQAEKSNKEDKKFEEIKKEEASMLTPLKRAIEKNPAKASTEIPRGDRVKTPKHTVSKRWNL